MFFGGGPVQSNSFFDEPRTMRVKMNRTYPFATPVKIKWRW